jgi:hypothetical protein
MGDLLGQSQPPVSFLPFLNLKKSKLFPFLVLGLTVLILVFVGVYWLRQSGEGFLKERYGTEQENDKIFVSPEEKLYADITSLSPSIVGGELAVEDILRYLEEIKEYHGSDDWMDQSSQYMAYLGAVSSLRGGYYASGGSPETRNPEILKVLAQFREMARENPYFDETHWEVAGIEDY